MLAALGAMLTASAVCEAQQSSPPNSQAQQQSAAKQTKRPATSFGAEAKNPGTSATTNPASPKPSVLDKAKSFFGMKKNSPDADKSADTNKPQQSRSFMDLFHRHSSPDKSVENTRGTATDAPRVEPKQAAGGAQNYQAGAAHGSPSSGRTAASTMSTARTAAPPMNEARMPNGNLVRTGHDGSVRELHSLQNNMSIHYGMNGSRQVRVDQPDGSRIVLASRGNPYIQRPWNFGSLTFDHRTYLDNGALTHQFYRPYSFAGTTLDAYAPQRFYSQDFYKWVEKPQMWTPPAWTYVTRQEPWYQHYRTYFTPQTAYASPAYWLTDFVLGMSLFESYNAHPLPAQPPPDVTKVMTSQSSGGQTANSSAPIVQAPVASTPAAAPVVTRPPPSSSPVAQPPTPQPDAPPSADGDGSSPSLWQRVVNYIRGLFGQTPVASPAASAPSEPVVAASAVPISDDVKNKVADEVQAQVDEEAREATANAKNQEPKAGAGGVVEELSRPSQHIFVVASDLDLTDDTGRRCMMTEGDVVQILSAADVDSGTAPGIVLSSKAGSECAPSAKVDIAITDLQEMQNHMRAMIDQGLANTPRGATEQTVTPPFAGAAPPPDADAKNEIDKQKAIASSVERG